MLQLNVVHLNTRNILTFNNLYIIHDHFEKKYSGKMCWILLQETDWLTDYFRITRRCYFQRFEDVYKTSTNFAEAYFLSSYRASNITTLKAKVLSPYSWSKHLGTSYSHAGLICSWILFTNQRKVIYCYQKISFTESIKTSFSTQYLFPKLFNVWG